MSQFPDLNPSEQVAQWSRRFRAALPIVALLVGMGALVRLAWLLPWAEAEDVPQAAPTIAAPELTKVTALGWIEPADEVLELSAPPSIGGTRLEKLLVYEGERVKAGQTIAILDNHDELKAALARARDNVQIAEAKLNVIQAGAKQGEISAQAARSEQDRAELSGQVASQRAAIATLEAQLDGERRSQTAQIERLQAEFFNADVDCDRYNDLYAGGAVPAQRRDSVCLAAVTAQERLQEAEAEYERILGSRRAQITEATATLDRTMQTLANQIDASDATLNAIAEVRPEEVNLARAELAAAESALEEAKANYNNAFIRAPQAGQVLEIHVQPGEAAGTQPIVDLGNTQQMYVVAEVYDSDIEQVYVGQTALITGDGFERSLQGNVEQIGLQIKPQSTVDIDPAANLDARIIEVRIRLDARSSQRAARLTNRQVTVSMQR